MERWKHGSMMEGQSRFPREKLVEQLSKPPQSALSSTYAGVAEMGSGIWVWGDQERSRKGISAEEPNKLQCSATLW